MLTEQSTKNIIVDGFLFHAKLEGQLCEGKNCFAHHLAHTHTEEKNERCSVSVEAEKFQHNFETKSLANSFPDIET